MLRHAIVITPSTRTKSLRVARLSENYVNIESFRTAFGPSSEYCGLNRQDLATLGGCDLISKTSVRMKVIIKLNFLFSFPDGKCVACTFRAKFIEVSVGINHNCDELLAGTLTQIQLKKEHNLIQVGYKI